MQPVLNLIGTQHPHRAISEGFTETTQAVAQILLVPY
jgi:hypothetical protein